MNEKDEIEITPEMIEAGADAIAERYGGLDLSPRPSVVARSVFLAMLSVAPFPWPAKRP
jgi:hypothetical protein